MVNTANSLGLVRRWSMRRTGLRADVREETCGKPGDASAIRPATTPQKLHSFALATMKSRKAVTRFVSLSSSG
jgi:hypothetical protein